MELVSFKFYLLVLVLFEISFGGFCFKKKYIVLIVLFIGIILVLGGFFFGYFLKGDKGRDSLKIKDKSEINFFNGDEVFSYFKKNVNIMEFEEILRYIFKLLMMLY